MATQSAKQQTNIFECCREISNGTFDEITVERFLINIRNDENCDDHGWLKEFGDLVAHGVRDRGKLYCAISKLENVNKEGVTDGDKTPIGHVGFSVEEISGEVNRMLSANTMPTVSDGIIEEFMLCLIAIGHTMLAVRRKDERTPIGKAVALVSKNQISLSVYALSGLLIAITVIPNKYTSEDPSALTNFLFEEKTFKVIRVGTALRIECDGQVI